MKEKGIKIIEVKSEIGAGTRGSSLGVEAIKIASLDMKSDFFRQHTSVEVENVNKLLFGGTDYKDAKFIDGVLMMEERTCLEVYEQIYEDNFPLIIAGDHSTAYGTICGIKKAEPDKRLGVIWIDAHADLNTPYTTSTGNMHGMALAMACDIDNFECKVNNPSGETAEYWEQIMNVGMPGAKIYPEDIVYIAVRALEKPENYLVNKFGMGFITAEELRTKGTAHAAKEALKLLDHCDQIYVSFDIHALDPSVSAGVGKPVANGLTLQEAKELNEELCKEPRLCAWEIAEINPTLDDQNKTAECAFEIIETAVKSIISRPVIGD
jgi:arginase